MGSPENPGCFKFKYITNTKQVKQKIKIVLYVSYEASEDPHVGVEPMRNIQNNFNILFNMFHICNTFEFKVTQIFR